MEARFTVRRRGRTLLEFGPLRRRDDPPQFDRDARTDLHLSAGRKLDGPHQLYRDRLARTFVRLRTKEGDSPLAEVNSSGLAPYHIINAAADLPSSASPRIRERRSDFFVFSKGWCGSPSIGYRRTAKWHCGRAPVDLATAMSVSGAAVSPHMGLGSEPSLSALLSLFNVRLNYWIKHPDASRTVTAPGFSCLLREMTGLWMSETSRWLSLSDGGHIENMGVYELLRRRCNSSSR